MKILIINGPNLNLLRSRAKDHYGSSSLEEIHTEIQHSFPDVMIELLQTNSENEIVEFVQNAPKSFDGIIINPGAFSHSSIALRDALELCNLPKVEVHLSNIQARDKFRNVSLTASVCNGYISGFKNVSYLAGVYTLLKLIEQYKSSLLK